MEADDDDGPPFDVQALAVIYSQQYEPRLDAHKQDPTLHVENDHFKAPYPSLSHFLNSFIGKCRNASLCLYWCRL